MKFKITNQRAFVSPQDGRAHSLKLPRRRTVLTVVLLLCAFGLLQDSAAWSYLQAGLRRANPQLAAQSVPALAGSVRTAMENMACVKTPPQTSELPTLHLVVPRNTLVSLEKSLVTGDPQLGHDPGGTKPYEKAVFIDEHGQDHRAKICLRGLMPWHHNINKPSLRVRIKKADVSQRQRYVELTRPEDALCLINYLPLKIAEDLLLVTNRPDHVRLFINRKYFGVYERSMRQGEPMALANGRMPGTFFKGDLAKNMWESVDNWKLSGESAPEDIAAFRQLLMIVNQLQTRPDATALRALETVLDFEAYARWAALMIVTGSLHTDQYHNHSYYFCSNQGRIEPMPWDPNSFLVHATPDVPADAILHPIMQAMTRDPRWVHRRDEWIAKLLNGACYPNTLRQRIDDRLAVLRPDLQADRHLGRLVLTNAEARLQRLSVAQLDAEHDRLINWIEARSRFLNNYLADAQLRTEPIGTNRTRVTVHGAVGIIASRGNSDRLLHTGRSEELAVHTGIPFEAPVKTPYAKSAPLVYELDGPPSAWEFANAITGAVVTANNSATVNVATRSIHPSELPAPDTRPITLGPGAVEIRTDLVTNPGQPLTVVAGTHLKIAAGVGIYCQGRTTFAGTSAAPIRVTPNSNEPFACVAIAGEASQNSSFRHVRIHGGSVGKLHHRRFKGMFSVYGSDNFTMSHCHVGRNEIGDDAVNIAECSARVTHCTWNNSRADALDLDMVTATVENCDWTNSGNDALDLMNCRVQVFDCQITCSGDKGISVGEDTRLVAERVHISDCLIGMECKDASRALVRNSQLTDNQTGVHAYQKKWFFSRGGSAAFVNCEIFGGRTLLDPEARCEFVLVNSATQIRSLPKRTQRVARLPKSCQIFTEAQR